MAGPDGWTGWLDRMAGPDGWTGWLDRIVPDVLALPCPFWAANSSGTIRPPDSPAPWLRGSRERQPVGPPRPTRPSAMAARPEHADQREEQREATHGPQH